MRIIQCVTAGTVFMMLTAGPASAQSNEDLCTGSSVAPDKKIAGCTELLKSREYHGDNLIKIYGYRASAYLSLKDYENAIADYNRAFERDITNTDLAYGRGIAYARLGNYEHAISDFTRAISGYDPKRYPISYMRDYYKERGNAYRGKQDYANAIIDYSESIKIDASFARAWYNRGEAKQKSGDTVGGDADIAKARALQKGIGPGE